jgi:hypothetical protein
LISALAMAFSWRDFTYSANQGNFGALLNTFVVS